MRTSLKSIEGKMLLFITFPVRELLNVLGKKELGLKTCPIFEKMYVPLRDTTTITIKLNSFRDDNSEFSIDPSQVSL